MKLLFNGIMVFCLLAFGVNTTTAQTKVKDVKVSSTYANFLGKTPPIRDLVSVASTTDEKRNRVKQNKKVPSNFAGRGKYVSTNPNALPKGEDQIRQKYAKNGGSVVIEPLVNRNGITSGTAPNDPTGDIGKDHYLQAVNATMLGVFDKEGNQLGNSFSANTIWNQVGFTSAGDPIILYDQEADRWIMTEFPFSNQLLVAVSETSDPRGSWNAYNFGTPNFPDYPKYAVWSNAYSVTTNEGGNSRSSCYFLNRESLLNGDANVAIQRIEIPGVDSGPGFQVDTPVDWTGLTPPPADASPIVVSMVDDAWGNGLQDQIDVYSFDIDWDNPDNTEVNVESVLTTPFDSNPCSATGFGFQCIPQLNGGGLDGLPETIMNQPHYRNFGSHESMIMTFVTDVTGGDNLAGIRWMEIRRSNGSEWSVYQEGTYAPDDGLDRFMPSICMDGNGNIGLAYNVSSEDIYAGVRFTGRRNFDPLGTMSVVEYNATDGFSTINAGGRFGDYAHMSVDPTNDRTFWFTTEYAGVNEVATRILAFELNKDSTDIGPKNLVTPMDSDALTDAETIVVDIQNFGIETQTEFQVGYIFEDNAPVIEDVVFTLESDSTYTHTFSSTIDLNEVRSYDLKLFTVLDGDQAILNDTLSRVITKLPQNDAGINTISNLNSVICGTSIDLTYDIINFGTLPLMNAIIIIDLNGITQNFNWKGNLNSGETETINITLTDLVAGTNLVTISTSNPNGVEDQNMNNDSSTGSFDAIIDGGSYVFILNTDEYPEETTWEILDEEGTILANGGPYEGQEFVEVTESFCLDPEECYIFNIYDSYGDGICCGYGEGSYSVVDPDGLPLLVSNGDFGSEESNEFCATFECMMDADIVLSLESNEGAADAAILITALNGIEPYVYSIDGGVTFQEDSFFNGLSGGTYNIVINGEAGCTYEETLVIPTCSLMASATVENDTDPDGGNGSITLQVSGGTPPYQFNSNGGANQNNNTFNNLEAGNYAIVVSDAIGCQMTLDVIVDMEVSSRDVVFGQSFEIAPNPTEGVFRITGTGITQASSILIFEIFDTNGKLIQKGNLTNYDGSFTGLVSLVSYPDGVYFVKFKNEDIPQMLRVVKQQ